jgi:glycolate oxidase FAD binding subunit
MSIAGADIPSRLANVVDASSIVADPTQVAAYRIDGKFPAAAVRPGSNEEVAEIVRFAADEKLTIVPMGAGTKLAMGMPPVKYDLALDMTRMDRVVAYDPNDLTLGVEPGMRLHDLAGVLAAHRQFLPLAVAFMNRATVGGTIASGIDSALRQSYGTARDYVLGMEFVTGDGRIVKSGGRVVKNVSGYDLHKLMIGAFGTLGVMTKINLRTFPLPTSTRGFVASAESADRVMQLRQHVAQSPLRPLTMEILSPGVIELLSGGMAAHLEPGQMPAGLSLKGQWTFVVSFAGTDEALARYERELRELAGAMDTALLDQNGAAVLLGRVREFVAIALESSPAATIVKMSVLPGRMTELLKDAESVLGARDLNWAALARGVGVLYFALSPNDRSEATRSRVFQGVEQLVEACRRLGGHAAVLWCPGEWKRSLAARKIARGDFEQMQKVKQVFDPSGVLAPDVLSGWI